MLTTEDRIRMAKAVAYLARQAQTTAAREAAQAYIKAQKLSDLIEERNGVYVLITEA